MRKSDKKIENNIRKVLTDVCTIALTEYAGFSWLTHFVNYSRFPDSLSIICVFDKNEQLDTFCADACDKELRVLITSKLSSLGIKIDNVLQQVNFDTEENCSIRNNGKWHERFRHQVF